jgi:hypothetical protein
MMMDENILEIANELIRMSKLSKEEYTQLVTRWMIFLDAHDFAIYRKRTGTYTITRKFAGLLKCLNGRIKELKSLDEMYREIAIGAAIHIGRSLRPDSLTTREQVELALVIEAMLKSPH